MSFYDVGNDMIIHGMYRLSKTRLRSTAKARSNASELVDIYLPVISNDFIGIC